jgi:uncharacterized protein YxeA
MNRLINKHKNKGLLNSKFILFILLILAVILINSAYQIFKKTNETKEYLNLLEEDYASLENRYTEVKKDLEYANSKTGLEREIRSKFDLSLQGEKAIVIIENDVPDIKPPEKKNFFQKIKDFVSF